MVLLLGIAGEGVVYRLGTRSADAADDPPLLVNEKAQARKAELLFGKQTLLLQQWIHALHQPGTQALIMIGTATLVAGGCFYFARLLDRPPTPQNGAPDPDAPKP